MPKAERGAGDRPQIYLIRPRSAQSRTLEFSPMELPPLQIMIPVFQAILIPPETSSVQVSFWCSGPRVF